MRLLIRYLLLLTLMPVLVNAQPCRSFSRDSLSTITSERFVRGWRFYSGDDAAMASPEYDDSQWKITDTRMDARRRTGNAEGFNGIGWFRLHICTDSSLIGFPLMLVLQHHGASELYLDGERIGKWGIINGKDSSEYFNPELSPVFFTFNNPGHHVLAVRYANYNARKNQKKYDINLTGFNIKLVNPQRIVSRDYDRISSNTFLFILLFGIFLALTVSHLFLYLYHRSGRSNLYFSFFCMGFAILFFAVWFGTANSAPFSQLVSYYTIPGSIALICFSLSGFVNDLFAKGRLRFRILGTLSIILPCIIWIFNDPGGVASFTFYILVFVILLEAIILIIRAIVRKVPGARIIGAGVLLFSLFVFFTLLYILINQSLLFEDNSIAALAFLTLAALSFLGLPVSMSLFLAWNFANVNKELTRNLKQVQELSDKTLAQELEKNRIIAGRKEELEREVAVRTAEVVNKNEQLELRHNELIAEKHKSDELLLNILPEEVAEELKRSGHADARLFNDVSVIFTDFVGFTSAGERMTPQELVDELHICFRTFDEIISRHHIEKIKTIGDAYLAVSGLPAPNDQHAHNVTKAALEILTFMKQRRQQLGDKTFEIRIGINSGSVVAGIVGIKKFAYDIWGDTVNTAARMEQNSEPGRINISENTWQLIKDHFRCTYRGMIDAKNKGELKMYFVEEQE